MLRTGSQIFVATYPNKARKHTSGQNISKTVVKHRYHYLTKRQKFNIYEKLLKEAEDFCM
jgi:hypothetical protein